MTFEQGEDRQCFEIFQGEAGGVLSAPRFKRSQQEDRHPSEDDDDHQDRNLDEPGEPDPGTAMPFEFWIYCRHIRLAG
jgi:hypothetical protein